MWVLKTCVSRCLIQHWRNYWDLISVLWENSRKLDILVTFPKPQFLTSFWTFSQISVIRSQKFLHCCIRHLETQVLSTHMTYFWDNKFSPPKGGLAKTKNQFWLKKNSFLRKILFLTFICIVKSHIKITLQFTNSKTREDDVPYYSKSSIWRENHCPIELKFHDFQFFGVRNAMV